MAPFDTLELAQKLEGAGFSRQQAEGAAGALADAFAQQDLATKQDIRALDHKIELLRRDMEVLRNEMEILRRDMEVLRRDLTIRLGSMLAAAVIVMGVLVRLF